MSILRMLDVTDRIKLNKRAHQKPLTSKPSTNLSVSRIIPAFITKRKNPIVNNVMGMVKMVRIGLTTLFIKASTKATSKEVQNESRNTPGKS
jgi:hypothetical protein